MTRPVQGIRLEVLRSPGPSDIQQAADIFLLDCRARKLSASTQDSYTRRLRAFLAWLSGEGVFRLADLTASHIRG